MEIRGLISNASSCRCVFGMIIKWVLLGRVWNRWAIRLFGFGVFRPNVGLGWDPGTPEVLGGGMAYIHPVKKLFNFVRACAISHPFSQPLFLLCTSNRDKDILMANCHLLIFSHPSLSGCQSSIWRVIGPSSSHRDLLPSRRLLFLPGRILRRSASQNWVSLTALLFLPDAPSPLVVRILSWLGVPVLGSALVKSSSRSSLSDLVYRRTSTVRYIVDSLAKDSGYCRTGAPSLLTTPETIGFKIDVLTIRLLSGTKLRVLQSIENEYHFKLRWI